MENGRPKSYTSRQLGLGAGSYRPKYTAADKGDFPTLSQKEREAITLRIGCSIERSYNDFIESILDSTISFAQAKMINDIRTLD